MSFILQNVIRVYSGLELGRADCTPINLGDADRILTLSERIANAVDIPPIQGPPIIDERDTSSTHFSPGEMTVMGFDPANGILELGFSSREQREEFYRRIAAVMADHGQLAFAQRMEGLSGGTRTITSLKVAATGAAATADQIRGEGDRWGAAAYDRQSDGAEQTARTQEMAYDAEIARMRAALPGGNVDLVLQAFERARALRPKAFKPYSFVLLLVGPMAQVFPKWAEKIVDQAYRHSPLETFNILLTFLIAKRQPSLESRAFIDLFFKRFPTDVVGYMVFNALLEGGHRDAFSEHLGQGLTHVRKGDFIEARKAFSAASYYHISDRRPYKYQAVIDLRNGDFLSTVRLSQALKTVVDWSDPNERSVAMMQVLEKVQGSETSSQQLPLRPESPVLSALLKFWRSSDKFDDVLQSLSDYLRHSNADFIWAGLVVDTVMQKYGDISKAWSNGKDVQSLINLASLLPSHAFMSLRNRGVDLSEYDGHITIQDDGHIVIGRAFQLTSFDSGPSEISIEPRTFQMPVGLATDVLEEILRERYGQYSLLFLQWFSVPSEFAGLFDRELGPDDRLHGPFVEALLKRFNEGGSLEDRIKLLRWANRHVAQWPVEQRSALTASVLRWQLDQPIPCTGCEDLSTEGHRWLAAIGVNVAALDDDLSLAFLAWEQLRSQNDVLAIRSFFADWENRMDQGVDPVAFRVLCLVKALLNDRQISQALPLSPETDVHREMIKTALKMISRGGVPDLYVVSGSLEFLPNRVGALCDHYLGQRYDETDTAYLKRLKAMHLPNPADLRQTRRVRDFSASDPSGPGWFIPITSPALFKTVADIVGNKTDLQQMRINHTQEIRGEKPAYTEDVAFIEWVRTTPGLISDYLRDRDGTVANFRRQCSRLPERVKASFIEELSKKAEHELALRELKQNTPRADVHPGRRFWQLVQQAANLIQTIKTTRRSDNSYDMVVENEAEAHFVMKLLYDWSRKGWSGDQKEFAEAFHGPETHTWGKGPRIPHFNAGVYFNGTLVNTHIYF
jgi:hypothetical protein